MSCCEMKKRIGFVGFGEVNTPREFITGRCRKAAEELAARGFDIIDGGIVSDDPAGEQADAASAKLGSGNFDALVVCVAGWIPTWAVIRTIDNFRHTPVLLWGLSGWQDGNRFVTTADQAGTTALRCVLAETGYKFKYLVNFMNGAPRYEEAAAFLNAACTAAALRKKLIGMAGYRDMRLYGTSYNTMLLKEKLGIEIEHFDLLELEQFSSEIGDPELAEFAKKLRNEWEFMREPQPGTVENSVRMALSFKRKIDERHYSAFSFCDVDGIKKLFKFAPAGAMTLLHELTELPTVPENDAYGAVTLTILHTLTGKLPGYLEFYEFTENSALMGVPDYVPGAIVQGKITVLPAAFGSFGEGLLNVSKLKPGKVTICRIFESKGELYLHAVPGNAVPPPAWEEAGWNAPAPQLPSLEVKFDFNSDEFLQNVAGQHYALVHGDHLNDLKEFCSVTGITFVG